METTIQTTTEQIAETGGKLFTFTTIAKFGGMCLLIMALIFILAVITPKLAKIVDKHLEKHRPERVNDRTDEVRSIYDLPPNDKNKTDEKNNDISDGKEDN